jgi:YVTN family beta-propeller protein
MLDISKRIKDNLLHMSFSNHPHYICILLILIQIILLFAIVTPFQLMAESPYTQPLVNTSSNSTASMTLDKNGHILSTMNELNVGKHPGAIAVNPSTNMIYVGNLFSDSVSVINGSTNKVVDNITVFSSPDDIAIDPSKDAAYVTNRYANIVNVINGSTNKVAANITLGFPPTQIAVDPTLHKIYVANMDNETVSVINGSTNKVVTNITLGISRGGIPLGDMAVNLNTHMVYIINNGDVLKYGDAKVSVINGSTNKVVDNITGFAEGPYHIAINPYTNTIYLSNADGNRLSIINGSTNKVERTIIVDTHPTKQLTERSEFDINPFTKTIYITNSGHNYVTAINESTNKVEKIIMVSGGPTGIAVNPNTNMIYITNEKSNAVSIIDGKTNNIMAGSNSNGNILQQNPYSFTTIGFKGGSGPTSIAVNSVTNKIYVGYSSSNKVNVFEGDSYKLIKTIIVESGAKKMAVNPIANKIYVSNQDSSTISIIDGDSDNLIRNIPVMGRPFDLAVDPYGNTYVTNRDFNIVSVIDSSKDKVISNISTIEPAGSISINPLTNKLYVTNPPNATISIMPPYPRVNSTISIIETPFSDYEYYPTISNITTGYSPSNLDVNPTTNIIYLINNGVGLVRDHGVYVIDGYTNQLISTLYHSSLDTLDSPLAINPDTNMVYVMNAYNVSVINGSSNKIVANITTGSNLIDSEIAINTKANMIYVTNQRENTITVINGSSNKLTVGINLNIDPPNSGHIKCNNRDISSNVYVIIDIYSQCIAEANTGFTFSSWSGNLASDLVNSSIATFNASNYGNLAANFRQAPSNIIIPNELLYGVFLGPIVGGIIGWLIPFIVDRYSKAKK